MTTVLEIYYRNYALIVALIAGIPGMTLVTKSKQAMSMFASNTTYYCPKQEAPTPKDGMYTWAIEVLCDSGNVFELQFSAANIVRLKNTTCKSAYECWLKLVKLELIDYRSAMRVNKIIFNACNARDLLIGYPGVDALPEFTCCCGPYELLSEDEDVDVDDEEVDVNEDAVNVNEDVNEEVVKLKAKVAELEADVTKLEAMNRGLEHEAQLCSYRSKRALDNLKDAMTVARYVEIENVQLQRANQYFQRVNKDQYRENKRLKLNVQSDVRVTASILVNLGRV
jgi:hypothetical protein